MKITKNTLTTLIISIFFAILSPFFVFASEEKISDSKKQSIVGGCDNILSILKSTQYSDSYARTYYGTIYDNFLSSFIVPLNVRLLKNNASDTILTQLQDDFVAEKSKFSTDFITYEKSFDELIKISCATQPEKFYSQLLDVRKKREIVDKDVSKLNNFILSQEQLIKKKGSNL